MGKPSWDKFAANDVLVSHSRAYFKKSKFLFILHRELKINEVQALELSLALANDAAFRLLVPPFLNAWGTPAKKGVERHGLDALAKAILDGLLTGKSNWRFGVTPVPAMAPKRRSKKGGPEYFFEIRFIIETEPKKLVSDQGLGQEEDYAGSAFFTELQAIKNVQEKHNRDLLGEIFTKK